MRLRDLQCGTQYQVWGKTFVLSCSSTISAFFAVKVQVLFLPISQKTAGFGGKYFRFEKPWMVQKVKMGVFMTITKFFSGH